MVSWSIKRWPKNQQLSETQEIGALIGTKILAKDTCRFKQQLYNQKKVENVVIWSNKKGAIKKPMIKQTFTGKACL